MPNVYVKKQERETSEKSKFVSEGTTDSEFDTTISNTDTLKISGDFSSNTTSPHTEGKVEVEDSATTS